jgi:hypothetical protein
LSLKFSARQKLDEDLEFLDRQLKLQQGEDVNDSGRPAEVLLASKMVGA